MKVHRAYKVRLYPNKAQEQTLLRTLGATRFVYNYFLSGRIGYYKEYGTTLSYIQMSRDLTHVRNSLNWLGDIQREPLQAALRRLDSSYSSFFKKNAGFPKFKSKKQSNQSFQKYKSWKMVGNKILIQKDLVVKFRGTIDKEKDLGSLIVSYQAGKWYASITAEVDVKLPKRHSKPVGLDLGLTSLLTASTGQKYENIQPQKSNQKRITRASRVLNRREVGSKRHAKARLELSRVHQKIANIRYNHLHQISSAITAKNHSLIAVEDLNVRGMVKNRHLSRAISDAGWSTLVRQIEYKQLWKGGEVVKIDRFFPSSKLCSVCDFMAETMPLSVRKWKCGGCNTEHDRDINAAKNILKEALAYRVRGVTIRPSRQVAKKRGQVTA